MVTFNIYYSLRQNAEGLPVLRLFADELSAQADQEYFKYWKTPCYGKFSAEVKGTAYFGTISTIEEFIEELENLPDPPLGLIHRLKR